MGQKRCADPSRDLSSVVIGIIQKHIERWKGLMERRAAAGNGPLSQRLQPQTAPVFTDNREVAVAEPSRSAIKSFHCVLCMHLRLKIILRRRKTKDGCAVLCCAVLCVCVCGVVCVGGWGCTRICCAPIRDIQLLSEILSV